MTDHAGLEFGEPPRIVPDCSQVTYAAPFLSREQADDAIYAVRAWARGIAWTSLLAAVGALCTALATRNWLAVAASLTGIVAVFLPSLNSTVVNEVIKTVLIKSGGIPQPQDELPIRPLPQPVERGDE